jgi:hypothetical protein
MREGTEVLSGFTLGLSLQPMPFLAVAAEFPDEALGTEPAIAARVGAGFAVLQALPAVAGLHLLAFHIGIPFGMKTAVQGRFLSLACFVFVFVKAAAANAVRLIRLVASEEECPKRGLQVKCLSF